VVSTQAFIPTSEKTTSYPAPEVNITENPYYPDLATAIIPNPGPTYTADPQMGYIRGRLLRNNLPVPNIVLDLAEVIKDDTGQDIIAGLDRVNSPNTVTDGQGNFAFINVKAGRYALILDIITNQFLLNYPGREDSIIVQVEAGQEVNLGDLNFDDLPVP
jgi:hypothetical protein